MLVDTIEIEAKAGDGGDGVVRWRREKYIPKGGPAGGDGGRGGDVYIRGVRDVSILAKYRHHPKVNAGDGEDGKSDNMHGANGIDAYLNVPIGSIVTHNKGGERYEVLEEGETVLVLRGGRGGYGNTHFKSSRNVAPQESTPGVPGEAGTFTIDLHLIADAGFVGLPNAGKSSLLNATTEAHAKIGAYPFTTIDPNLGVFHEYILADIPGLIEGASEGRGLGHTFLRHITRTRVLLHCISLERESVIDTYHLVRDELKKFNPALLEKPELVVLTKSDLVEDGAIADARQALKDADVPVVVTSVSEPESIEHFAAELSRFLQTHTN